LPAAVAAASELMPSAAASSPLSLGQLTALTRLLLYHSSTEGCSDVCAWLARELAHLPHLRNLDLSGFKTPYTSAGAAALASRLQQITGLTRLCLWAD
jgi:hypothetical protein